MSCRVFLTICEITKLKDLNYFFLGGGEVGVFLNYIVIVLDGNKKIATLKSCQCIKCQEELSRLLNYFHIFMIDIKIILLDIFKIMWIKFP